MMGVEGIMVTDSRSAFRVGYSGPENQVEGCGCQTAWLPSMDAKVIPPWYYLNDSFMYSSLMIDIVFNFLATGGNPNQYGNLTNN